MKIVKITEFYYKYIRYSNYNSYLLHFKTFYARNIRSCRKKYKDIEILPISIYRGYIIAPFLFEKLLDFECIGSVPEKKATAYMYVYCAHS